jgi:hypothetical protein
LANARDIEMRTLALLKHFENAIPADRYSDLVELAMHNEWGVALENLCQNLNDDDAPVGQGELEEIQALTADMGMPATTWDFLVSPRK